MRVGGANLRRESAALARSSCRWITLHTYSASRDQPDDGLKPPSLLVRLWLQPRVLHRQGMAVSSTSPPHRSHRHSLDGASLPSRPFPGLAPRHPVQPYQGTRLPRPVPVP
jgi:hypothetical protein